AIRFVHQRHLLLASAPVRVGVERGTAPGLLDFLGRGLPMHAQNLVIGHFRIPLAFSYASRTASGVACFHFSWFRKAYRFTRPSFVRTRCTGSNPRPLSFLATRIGDVRRPSAAESKIIANSCPVTRSPPPRRSSTKSGSSVTSMR